MHNRHPVRGIRLGARWGTRLLPWTLALLSLNSWADTQTRTSAFDYDAGSGLLNKEIIEPGNSNLCLVTSYTLDAYGNRTAATTRNCNGSAGSVPGTNSEAAAPTGDAVIASRSTSNTFDVRGQFPTGSTNALNQSETKAYDARFGAVTSLNGPNGLTTTWSYDSFGRKTLETRADGTKTKWDYLYCSGVNGGTAACPTVGGAAGAWVMIVTPLASDGVTQSGPIGKVYYDALSREIRSETQGFDGSGSSTPIYKDTQYDSLGRPYMSSRPYYSGQTVYWSTVTYDALGRAVQVTNADGTAVTTAYNGLVTTVIDPNGQNRVTTKNSQGQIVSVKDPANQTLTFSYDPFGNLVKTTDPLGNSTTLVYDQRGRKTQMVDPDMGTWNYVYDALGQLVRQTDAKGQVTTQSYDKLGRMTNRAEADLISNWYYDSYKGGAACAKGIGKLCQAETSTGYNRTHNYDSLGRPSSTSTVIDTSYTASVSYDSLGRVATQTYPGGKVVKSVYTALGYLKELRDNASNALYWQANTLDAEGHLLLQTYGNGVQTTQTYTASNGRLNAIQAGAGNSVLNMGYQYDSVGNVTTRTDSVQGVNETFLYDNLNRLTSATVNSGAAGIVSTSFSFDALGNISSKSDIGSYVYNASGVGSVRPHAVNRVNFNDGSYRTYQYDANGNLTTETQYTSAGVVLSAKSRTEVYTSFNMPQSMGSAAITSAFYYGPEHQRVKQLSSVQGTTIYLNPGNNGDLSYEKDTRPDGSVEQRSFLSAGGQVVAVIKQTTVSGTTTTAVRYFHRDHLGSTSVVSDEAGVVVERLAYDAFGRRRFASGVADPNGTIMPLSTDRGYTNHEHIDELALIHMNGRIYDPVIGRFMSADPFIQDPNNPQSYNRYSYVMNNPLHYTDPTGYSWWTKLRDTAIRVVAAVADAYGCSGYCSAAVGAYQGYKAGGLTGAITGAIGGYYGSQYSIFDSSGAVNWGNVEVMSAINAATGCINASSAGGSCSRGALSGAVGTIGSAYGPMGSIISGCAAGRISGGSCSQGAWGNLSNYAVSTAVQGGFDYILRSVARPYLSGDYSTEPVIDGNRVIFLEKDDPNYAVAIRTRAYNGELLLISHGGLDGLTVAKMTGEQMAKFLVENHLFQPGMVIRVDACWAGMEVKSGLGFAQSLANSLQTTVIASPVRTLESWAIFGGGSTPKYSIAIPKSIPIIGGRAIPLMSTDWKTFRPQ